MTGNGRVVKSEGGLVLFVRLMLQKLLLVLLLLVGEGVGEGAEVVVVLNLPQLFILMFRLVNNLKLRLFWRLAIC